MERQYKSWRYRRTRHPS